MEFIIFFLYCNFLCYIFSITDDGPVGDGPVGDGPVGDVPVGDGPVGDEVEGIEKFCVL